MRFFAKGKTELDNICIFFLDNYKILSILRVK